ncbi:hypothetical protein COBT_004092, partial [Conglomerata obtusa]
MAYQLITELINLFKSQGILTPMKEIEIENFIKKKLQAFSASCVEEIVQKYKKDQRPLTPTLDEGEFAKLNPCNKNMNNKNFKDQIIKKAKNTDILATKKAKLMAKTNGLNSPVEKPIICSITFHGEGKLEQIKDVKDILKIFYNVKNKNIGPIMKVQDTKSFIFLSKKDINLNTKVQNDEIAAELSIWNNDMLKKYQTQIALLT